MADSGSAWGSGPVSSGGSGGLRSATAPVASYVGSVRTTTTSRTSTVSSSAGTVANQLRTVIRSSVRRSIDSSGTSAVEPGPGPAPANGSRSPATGAERAVTCAPPRSSSWSHMRALPPACRCRGWWCSAAHPGGHLRWSQGAQRCAGPLLQLATDPSPAPVGQQPAADETERGDLLVGRQPRAQDGTGDADEDPGPLHRGSVVERRVVPPGQVGGRRVRLPGRSVVD